MLRILLIIIGLSAFCLNGCSQGNKAGDQQTKTKMEFKKLTPEEEYVIVDKGTERPYSGKYENFSEKGTYVCKRCGAPLYRSEDKFDAQCGWPSFDDEITGAIKRIPDADGMRTEIECARCGAHLGHVFKGEGLTSKNTRHCVNSISMEFIPAKAGQSRNIKSGKGQDATTGTDTAIFAGGCFWGVQYFMEKAKGVVSTTVGYTGGHTDNPTYQQVCSGNTGHYEAIEVVFDPAKTSFEEVVKLFFEIHDPTQFNHQGPDWGEQYRSAVFYRNEDQKKTTEKLIAQLKAKGFTVVTEVRPAKPFWKAEGYHQAYYDHKGTLPYCHGFVQRF